MPTTDFIDDTTALAVIIGGLITLVVSWVFYLRAFEEVKEEAENLRKLNVLTIRILDEAGLLPPHTKAIKDETGNYTGGLAHSRTAISKFEMKVSHKQELSRSQEPQQE